jgi:twitching motility protein PilT
MLNLYELLTKMVEKNASDLHLTVGAKPTFRIDGELVAEGDVALLPKDTKEMAYSILTEKQKKLLETQQELDLSFGVKNLSRFRANAFIQRGSIAVSIRSIPYSIPSFNELGLPEAAAKITMLTKGLVLVTGPTGSGKSSTLAAIIDKINNERACHILTIEDPIEFIHNHKEAIVNQRELHSDTFSFATALKYALRQDPDVLLIGEMRDAETISAALTIAETGHLTLATLHTNSATESINRIIDVFPSHQQTQIRTQLSFVLIAVFSQLLIPKIRGGRCLASEIMFCNPAIRALVRDNKIHQIYSHIQAGQNYGMCTMNSSILEVYSKGLISYEEALKFSPDRDEFVDMLQRVKFRVKS